MPKTTILRTRTGCLTCRERHVKCDEGSPSCNRCVKGGKECVRGLSIGFRHGQNPGRDEDGVLGYGKITERFDPAQEWVTVPANLSFVDETNVVASNYDVVPELETSDVESSHSTVDRYDVDWIATLSVGEEVAPTQHRSISFSHARHTIQFSPEAHSSDFLTSHSPVPSDVYQYHAQASPTVARSSPSDHGISLAFNPSFTNLNEAYLLRHYSETIGPCLDVTDPQQHFTIDICQRARTSPILLSAVMAVAAQHLSRTTGYDATEAERYHERGVNLLIPLLNDDSTVKNDNMLAATVLFRFFEQMICPAPSDDHERHLAGCSAFVNAQRSCATAGGLRQAAFWVFVRQDMYMALYNQRRLMFNLADCNVEISFGSDADENTWANWMVWIAAEVVDFCFGGGDGERIERWDVLRGKCENWFECKPKSFDPLYYAERAPEEGKYLPELWMACPWHITALQYYCLAKILLTVHNPSRPIMGLGVKRAQRRIEDEVLRHSRALLATCFSNKFVPARLMACCAVVAYGPFLKDRGEQELLVDLLQRTDADIAWPTADVIKNLVNEWGW